MPCLFSGNGLYGRLKMPYIKQEQRILFDPYGGMNDQNSPSTSGELNFVLTRIVSCYFKDHPNYQGINDIVGALEGAKLEFYRRVAVPYEDKKIIENGDVY
jgi:hypothetical protein